MTDRHAAYLVVLDKDIREDDAGPTLTALRMVRGVQSVQPVVADMSAQQIARSRADAAWRERILGLLKETP